MAPPTNRDEALVRLRQTIASGKIILGAGAGIGLSAKFIDKGGADLIEDGRIKVKSGVSPERLTEDSVVLSDGTELPVDLVVFA